jgi:hypothetical protein
MVAVSIIIMGPVIGFKRDIITAPFKLLTYAMHIDYISEPDPDRIRFTIALARVWENHYNPTSVIHFDINMRLFMI